MVCGAVPKDPDQDLDQSVEMEQGVEDICKEGPPPSMVDNAHEVLTEEIQSLQVLSCLMSWAQGTGLSDHKFRGRLGQFHRNRIEEEIYAHQFWG